MKKIFICSPLRGDQRQNEINAELYCKEVVKAGHIPFAPHLFFTRFLDDNILEERYIGIAGGMEFLRYCDEVWVYGDSLSEGMKAEIRYAVKSGIKLFNMSKIQHIEWKEI